MENSRNYERSVSGTADVAFLADLRSVSRTPSREPEMADRKLVMQSAPQGPGR